MKLGFKKDFVWGAATSSYQIEGAAGEDGRGETVWDVFSHTPGKTFDGHTGDVACDHYHRFHDDIKIMKEIGIKAYRFSVCWTRILPDGTGKVNEKGVKFYSDLIDELLKNGIEPYVTVFHWDYPYELYKKGGWMNDESVKWFADYAALVTELFSDRVKYFITFNEPQCFIGKGFYTGEDAPGLKCTPRDTFLMCHNVLKAHGAAVLAMRKAAKKPIKIGYAPTAKMVFPASNKPADVEAARKKLFSCAELDEWIWNLSWWSDPIILGSYPEDGLKKYAPYLPEITAADMELMHQPIDFYCQNIYQGEAVAADENGEAYYVPQKPGFARTAMNRSVTPECMYWVPKFLCERYKLPFYISENGTASNDIVSADGCVHDTNRIEFLRSYIEKLAEAAEDGADISGYFQWSLMDNFEWSSGYAPRFGMVYVDYETQKRIIKDSGYWYRDMIKTGKYNGK